MIYDDSLSSLSLASSHSEGISLFSLHMAGGGHVRVNRLKPRTPNIIIIIIIIIIL